MNDMERLTPEPENCERFSDDVTYGINFITKGLLHVNQRVVKNDEKFTIPQQYHFGECEIRNALHYRFYPGITYSISDNRILEYSGKCVKIYDFHENPCWSDNYNEPFKSPCLAAVSVQTWDPGQTECLSELWGYANRFGEIIIPAQYDKATDLNCWNIGAVKQHGKWHFIYALTGERISNREYDIIIWSTTGYFSYSAKEQGDVRGAIDPLGNMITRPIYGTMPYPMFDGTFKTFMKKSNKPIFINRQERVLDMDTETASAPYDVALYWKPDYRRSEKDLWYVIPCIIVGRNGKYGLVAHSGRKITKLEYDNIFEYDIIPNEKSGMVFRVARNDKWGLIDDTGKEILATVYDCIVSGDSRHIRIVQDEKLGFADLQGTITLPPVYERLDMNGEGVAAGLIDGKWQIIGTDGEMITPPC